VNSQMRPRQSVSLAEYSRCLSDSGIAVYPGSPGTVWVGYFKGSATRLPTHCMKVPTPFELREIFSHNCYVAAYIIPPDERHPPNKWLYVADSTTYDPEKLSRYVRRNIRRAQKSLRFSELSWDELRTHGELPFCETRTRLGHPDRMSEHFQRHVASFSRNPAHFAIGAWLENRLVAFATFVAVDDWVEWLGMFSTDADRPNHPSDGMYHYILNRFLFEEKQKVVCASVGSAVDTPGLHQFKLHNGFQGIPVHRTFSSPVWIRPLLNPVTLFAARTALRWNPKNRRLEKAVKALQEIVQPVPLLADQGEDTNEV
jgi:hypothetical protein